MKRLRKPLVKAELFDRALKVLSDFRRMFRCSFAECSELLQLYRHVFEARDLQNVTRLQKVCWKRLQYAHGGAQHLQRNKCGRWEEIKRFPSLVNLRKREHWHIGLLQNRAPTFGVTLFGKSLQHMLELKRVYLNSTVQPQEEGEFLTDERLFCGFAVEIDLGHGCRIGSSRCKERHQGCQKRLPFLQILACRENRSQRIHERNVPRSTLVVEGPL